MNTMLRKYHFQINDTVGTRTRKVVEKGNIREERYYFNGYEVFRRYNNNTLDFERTTMNISDDEKVFARIEQKTNENEIVRYQYDNHLGSARLELDESGAIISYEEYHPFGTTSYRSGRSDTEVSLKRYKYCGKERDEESGLYYYGMRYYAVWLCRFVSVDPLQFEYPELTPFQYASNNPATMIDLDGLEGIDPQKKYTFRGGIGFNKEEERKNIIKELVAMGIEPTAEVVNRQLRNKAMQKIAENKLQGIKVDNYGNTRQSPRLYVDAEAKRLRGEDPHIDMGGPSDRGTWTTRGMGYETKNITKLKLIGNTVKEAAGVISDAITLAEVMYGTETPFALINPLSFVLTDMLTEDFYIDLEYAIYRGYAEFEKFYNNTNNKIAKKYFEDKVLVYLDDDEFYKVMTGEITSLSQIEGNVQLRGKHGLCPIVCFFYSRKSTSIISTSYEFCFHNIGGHFCPPIIFAIFKPVEMGVFLRLVSHCLLFKT